MSRRKGPDAPRQTWTPASRVEVGRCAAGVIIDGTVSRLDGEPPVAKSHGWGKVPGQ